VAVLLWTPAAAAFHAGNVFDKPPGAGGGGGVFYAGAPRERGWSCAACHLGAEGAIKISLTADPPDLLQSLRYEPGRKYALRATMIGEHLGAGAANFNSIVVVIVGADGTPSGEISGYAADEIYNGGATTIASAGQKPGETAWSFTWTAPAEGAGAATVHIAAVDGNGANGEGGGTLTDPWGDDVFVGALTLEAGTRLVSAPPGHDARGAVISICCLVGLRRRTRGERR
jgi:hypothetical protein